MNVRMNQLHLTISILEESTVKCIPANVIFDIDYVKFDSCYDLYFDWLTIYKTEFSL